MLPHNEGRLKEFEPNNRYILRKLTTRMKHEFCDTLPQSAYSYHPIHNQKIIRLLTLYPGEAEEPLDGRLQYVPLQYAKDYDALSYAWGSAEKPSDIVLHSNGSVATLPITASLHDALLHLRHPDTALTLWVDAVCICQSDDEEKSMQVAIMSHIYSSAKRVLCWIGSTVDGAISLQLLDDLSRTNFGELPGMNVTHDFMRRKDLPPQGDSRWAALSRFFNLAWFRRGWILQEVYHGRVVIIVCPDAVADLGDITLGIEATLDHGLLGWGLSGNYNPSTDLAGLASLRGILQLKACNTLGGYIHHEMSYFSNNDQGRQPWLPARQALPQLSHATTSIRALGNGLALPYSPTMSNLTNSLLRAQGIPDINIRIPLQNLLRLNRFCITTDPRDRYFALLSISSDRDNPSLQPDYSEPLNSTRIRFGRHFVLHQTDPVDGTRPSNVLISSGISTLPEEEGGEGCDLPSWIPDTDPSLSRAQAVYGMGYSTGLPYSAAGKTRVTHRPAELPSSSSLDPRRTILTSGITISNVSCVVPHPFATADDDPSDDAAADYFRSLDGLIGDRTEPYPSETCEDVVWRTLIAGIDVNFQLVSEGYRGLYLETRKGWEDGSLIEDLAASRDGSGTGKRRLVSELLNEWGKRWIAVVVAAEYGVCVLENGMVGLIPGVTRVGDRVRVVFGESMPLVLRRAEEEGGGDGQEIAWKIVGVAYVHGIMRGEMLEKGEGQEEEFLLV